MKENNIEKLYELLEKAEKDSEMVSTLRWAIFNLANR